MEVAKTKTITQLSIGQGPSGSSPLQGKFCACAVTALINNNTNTPKMIFNFMKYFYVNQRYKLNFSIIILTGTLGSYLYTFRLSI